MIRLDDDTTLEIKEEIQGVVTLHYKSYLGLEIPLSILQEAHRDNKSITLDNIDTNDTKINIKRCWTAKNGFVITTEESYTDNLDHQTMTLFHVPFTMELKDYLFPEPRRGYKSPIERKELFELLK